MSESLRNDGRVWVPKRKEDCGKPPGSIAEADRDYYLERKYPSFGNLAPRDISSRAAKEACDEGRGVGPGGRGVYLDFADAIKRLGENVIRERYGNLFDMYEKITGENAYQAADAHLSRRALHHGRPVGGLQPDEHPARLVRPRRSQLLRPRREPPRRQRADAGPGRRLLRPALHHRPLLRDLQAAEALRQPCRVQESRGRRQRLHQPPAGHQRQAHAHFPAPRAGQAALGEMRHGAQRGRPERGAPAHPRTARRVLEERQRHRRERRA